MTVIGPQNTSKVCIDGTFSVSKHFIQASHLAEVLAVRGLHASLPRCVRETSVNLKK
jgi:hypothetical protein